jgi:hypothetical protein
VSRRPSRRSCPLGAQPNISVHMNRRLDIRQLATTAAASLFWAMALRNIDLLISITSMDPVDPLVFSGLTTLLLLYVGFGLLVGHRAARWIALTICAFKILLPLLVPLGTLVDAIASILALTFILFAWRSRPPVASVGA